MEDTGESLLHKKEKLQPTPCLGSCRLSLAIMAFLGFCNLYMLRVNMSVAIVCMVNQTALRGGGLNKTDMTGGGINQTDTRSNDSVTLDRVLIRNETSMTTMKTMTTTPADDSVCFDNRLVNEQKSEDGEFVWEKETQGIILGSFYWGYICTQIVGGWLSTRFGGKRVFGWFMFVCAVSALLTPFAARTHVYFLVFLRFLAGFCQGVVWPAQQSLWASWAPPLESSRLGGFGYAGSQIGNVITFPLAALLCEYGFDGGWSSVFYLFGGVGIIWFVAWMYFVHDSPQQHPRISEEEKTYILKSLEGKMSTDKKSIPWLKILTSIRVWAIFVAHTCANWGTYTFLTNIPTYLKEVLKFDIKKNGLLSALPYIGFWLMINVSGNLADILRRKQILNTTYTRKLFNSLGMLVPAAFVIGLGFMDCTHSTLAVALLTIGVAFCGCQYGSGFLVNPGDIAPRYAGVIFGISNTFATIPGFLAPITIGIITKNRTQSEWQVVFYIGAAIYTVGALFYIVFGTGDLQSWALDKKIKEELILADNGTCEMKDNSETSKEK